MTIQIGDIVQLTDDALFDYNTLNEGPPINNETMFEVLKVNDTGSRCVVKWEFGGDNALQLPVWDYEVIKED